MEILVLVGTVVGLLVGAGAGYLVHQKLAGARTAADTLEAERLLADARRDADSVRREADIEVRQRMLEMRQEAEQALEERRAELAKIEERTLSRDESVEQKSKELDRREQGIADREQHARELQEELKTVKEQGVRDLERISGMTTQQARDQLLKETEEQVRHDMAKLVRKIEAEAKQESDRRVRNIIAIGIQRTAASHASATTVSMVDLPSDELKGRIIGREGRNIRALETVTGVDVIIDDTPGCVILSAFDGVRRETAKLTLEKLLADGRIHPARIEEMYYQAKAEMEERIVEAGERASFEANVPGLHPELLKALGRLNYRTSLRPERPQALPGVRAPRGDHGRRARRLRAHRPPRGPAARHRQGREPRGRGLARHHLGPALPQVQGVGRGHPRRRGPPLRRRAADRRGRAGAGRRRHLRRPPGGPRREPGELHQAPGVAGGDRDVQAGRGEVLRHAGRPRRARDGQARRGRRRHGHRCSPARSPARSRRPWSTPGRSRSR